jgi:hypothetical protein
MHARLLRQFMADVRDRLVVEVAAGYIAGISPLWFNCP